MNTDPIQTKKKIQSKVHKVIHLTPSTYILRLEKGSLNFYAGQYIVINFPGKRESRKYSIYNGENESFIEVLIKEVENGYVSRLLKNIKPGDILEIEGPFGHFVIDDNELSNKNFLFIASGTGISPFHSFIKSYPDLNYFLIHGIKNVSESYGKNDYNEKKYLVCTSQNNSGDFEGRVTDYLLKQKINPNNIFYLCGNSSMIDDVHDILEAKGVPTENIRVEIYF